MIRPSTAKCWIWPYARRSIGLWKDWNRGNGNSASKMRVVPLMTLALAALAGCTPRHTLYAWGHYEESIYTSYAKPGQEPPEKQIEALERDYQIARSQQQAVPP